MMRHPSQSGHRRFGAFLALLTALSLAFAGGAAKDPLAGSSNGASGSALVIGSSD